MSDLIDDYTRKGLLPDPTACFRECVSCGERYHPEDLQTIDDGDSEFEICNECLPTLATKLLTARRNNGYNGRRWDSTVHLANDDAIDEILS